MTTVSATTTPPPLAPVFAPPGSIVCRIVGINRHPVAVGHSVPVGKDRRRLSLCGKRPAPQSSWEATSGGVVTCKKCIAALTPPRFAPGDRVVLTRAHRLDFRGRTGVVELYVRKKNECRVRLDDGQLYVAFADTLDAA